MSVFNRIRAVIQAGFAVVRGVNVPQTYNANKEYLNEPAPAQYQEINETLQPQTLVDITENFQEQNPEYSFSVSKTYEPQNAQELNPLRDADAASAIENERKNENNSHKELNDIELEPNNADYTDPPIANSELEQRPEAEQQTEAEQETALAQAGVEKQESASEQDISSERENVPEKESEPAQENVSEKENEPEQENMLEKRTEPEQENMPEKGTEPEQENEHEYDTTPVQESASKQTNVTEREALPEQEAETEQDVTPEMKPAVVQDTVLEPEEGTPLQEAMPSEGVSMDYGQSDDGYDYYGGYGY